MSGLPATTEPCEIDCRGPVEVGDDSAGFANDQNAGRNVPRREHELPEPVESPARDVGKVERGRSGAPDAGGVRG